MRLPHKYLNLGLLVLGFGLGQGTLFLANTYLYWTGGYRLVAEFGAANALATFFFFIGDWGSLVYLAKEAVTRDAGHKPVETTFVALSLFRGILAGLFVVSCFAYYAGSSATFLGEYLKYSGLGLIAYAFNANGLLDGRGRSGISGLTQAAPVVAAAVALPFCVGWEEPVAGRFLGLAYAGGMAVAIAAQLAAIRLDWRRALTGMSPRDPLSTAWQSLPYMLMPLPGHILFRGQVLLATHYLSTALVALFIYCRQIVGIGYQALGFYLRVDIRDFAEVLKKGTPTAMSIAFTSSAVWLGGVGTVATALVALVVWSHDPALGGALLMFSPCILSMALTCVFQRAFVLRSRAMEANVILFSSVLMCAVYIFIFDGSSINTLFMIEISSQLFQCMMLMARWR